MKPDLTLAIETSNPSSYIEGTPGPRPGVALLAGDTALGVEPVADAPRDDLMRAVDRLFERTGRTPGALTRVCVSAGPGGFTAVRLAITAAKMIAEATGAACIGVPTALCVARRVAAAGEHLCVALASKGETTYLTRFTHSGTAWVPGPAAIVGADALDGRCGMVIADQFLPRAMRDWCAALGVPVVPPVFDPVACAEAAEGLTPVDPVDLLPIYPREPEAVTKWRQLHPPGGGAAAGRPGPS